MLEGKKVLVIRFSSIGDIVLTSPVVRWLKVQTGAEIHFLTKSSFVNLVAYSPYIDRVFTSDAPDIGDILKKEHYDLIVDLHKSRASALISFRLGVKRITFDKLNIQKWIYVNLKWNVLPDKHLVDRYLASLEHLGIKDDGMGLDFFFEPDIASSMPDLPSSYHVLVLGAAHATKRIPDTLANRIIAHNQLPVVLIGGKDVTAQAAILEQIPNVINLVGMLSIHASAKVIQDSNHVYTGDTGMMHIAAALKKNTTVFWGNTSPKFGMYPYYGFESGNNFVNKEVELSCRPCSKLGHNSCPKKHFKCMLDQVVE